MSAKQYEHRMAEMERLFKAFQHKLYLFALTYLNDTEEAHDVVSSVFETIWQQWHMGKAVETTPTYLYTLTKNRCIDLIRREKARRNYADLLNAAEQFDTSAAVHNYEQRIVKLQEAMETLPEPGKTILNCCYFKHMSYQETADALQLSLVVVRKNMLKVFKMLREKLKNTNSLV